MTLLFNSRKKVKSKNRTTKLDVDITINVEVAKAPGFVSKQSEFNCSETYVCSFVLLALVKILEEKKRIIQKERVFVHFMFNKFEAYGI